MTAADEHLSPRFFIIGERKCGTSSLYRYLIAHPNVLPGLRKEPDFFGQHDAAAIEAQLPSYLAQFPRRDGAGDALLQWPELDARGILFEEPVRFERVAGRVYITGEASANTFFDVSPALLHRFLPDARLILLVRDPVERAWSHHRMYQRFQAEGRDLGFSVGDFAGDMRAEIERVRGGGSGPCVSPGIYIDRLPRWMDVWGAPRLRVYRCEDLADPAGCRAITGDVQDYLELPRHDYGAYLERRFNRAPPAPIPAPIRAELAAFYAPYNRALEEYLGRPMGWG